VARIYNSDVSVHVSVLCENCDTARYFDVVFANIYPIQIIATGFAEYFLALSQDGSTDLFKNLGMNSLQRDLSNNTTFSHLFSHWSIPLNDALIESSSPAISFVCSGNIKKEKEWAASGRLDLMYVTH
jgi:hypothetical protein